MVDNGQSEMLQKTDNATVVSSKVSITTAKRTKLQEIPKSNLESSRPNTGSLKRASTTSPTQNRPPSAANNSAKVTAVVKRSSSMSKNNENKTPEPSNITKADSAVKLARKPSNGVVKKYNSPSRVKVNSIAPRKNSLAASGGVPSFEAGVLEKVYLQQIPTILPVVTLTSGLTPLLIDSTGQTDIMISATKDKPYMIGSTELALKSPNGQVVIDTKDLHKKVFMEKKMGITEAKIYLRDKLLQALYQGATLVFKGGDVTVPFEKYYDDDYFPSSLFMNAGSNCLKSEVWSKLLASGPSPVPPAQLLGWGITAQEYVESFSPNVEFNVLVTSTFTVEEYNDGFLNVGLNMKLFAPIAVKTSPS